MDEHVCKILLCHPTLSAILCNILKTGCSSGLKKQRCLSIRDVKGANRAALRVGAID